MSEAEIKYIVWRIMENANDACEEWTLNQNDDFYKGKRFAYYEVLDTIKNELRARNQNLEEYGLDISLEKKFL